MTNFEYIKTLDLDQLGHFLCDTMDDFAPGDGWTCDNCPVANGCCARRNGWINWLRGEKHE